jgi:cytochrome bd-type quinol oxidase subunit 2
LIAAMLGGAAFAMYPLLLPSSRDGIPSLTTTNTLAPPYGPTIGLRWWTIGFFLAVCYFVWTYRSIAAKVDVGD